MSDPDSTVSGCQAVAGAEAEGAGAERNPVDDVVGARLDARHVAAEDALHRVGVARDEQPHGIRADGDADRRPSDGDRPGVPSLPSDRYA